MYAAAPDMSSVEVLRAFHRDAPYLFLGASFVAVGLVAAAFAAIRRGHDSLLIYFSLFAVFYGLRLWIHTTLLGITVQGSPFFTRLRSGTDYIPIIFAVLFFNSLGLLTRLDRIVAYAVVVVSTALAFATFISGPSAAYHLINNVIVITALVVLSSHFLSKSPTERSSPAKADFIAIRWGLMIFAAFALWDNLAGVLSISSPRIEPYGFAVFLGCLGYVAARQTLHRDQQLSEIQKELEVARRIQLSILPADFPNSTHFRVAARYVPMTSVAGDFYDYILADYQQVGILIADVSGHGVPAALIASMVKLAAASQRHIASDPSRFLSAMNTSLFGNTQDQFITAAYVHLNSESRELRYSAAGHPPMLLLRNGQIIEIEENGLVLAAFDFATYSNAIHRLERGDRLLLYTDGILEATDASGDFLGHDALCSLLRKTSGLSSSQAADSIISSVRQFSAKQDDDLTVLVCDYVGAASETTHQSSKSDYKTGGAVPS
jgi:sigma-B regulation protein RsbU (phosphoserine phosphatase)